MDTAKTARPTLKELLSLNEKLALGKKLLESDLEKNNQKIAELTRKNHKLNIQIIHAGCEIRTNNAWIILLRGVSMETKNLRDQILGTKKSAENQDLTVRAFNLLNVKLLAAHKKLIGICEHNFVLDYHGWAGQDDGNSDIYYPSRLCVVCGVREDLPCMVNIHSSKLGEPTPEFLYKVLIASKSRLIRRALGEKRGRKYAGDPVEVPLEKWLELFEKSVAVDYIEDASII